MDTPAPEEKPQPLLLKEDSIGGESRAMNISLRGWMALLFVVTFCVVCVALVFRIGDASAAAGIMKDLFVPALTMVLTFYFVTKPNNPNPK